MQWASPVTKVKRLKVASKNDIKMPHLPEVAYWGQAKQDNKPPVNEAGASRPLRQEKEKKLCRNPQAEESHL